MKSAWFTSVNSPWKLISELSILFFSSKFTVSKLTVIAYLWLIPPARRTFHKPQVSTGHAVWKSFFSVLLETIIGNRNYEMCMFSFDNILPAAATFRVCLQSQSLQINFKQRGLNDQILNYFMLCWSQATSYSLAPRKLVHVNVQIYNALYESLLNK